jgi:hypothetical protein
MYALDLVNDRRASLVLLTARLVGDLLRCRFALVGLNKRQSEPGGPEVEE